MLINDPLVQVNVLEQVNVCPAISSVPEVNVQVVHVVVPEYNVVVPLEAPLLITNGPIVVNVAIVPVPTIVAVSATRLLVLLLDTNELKFWLVAAIVKEQVPK